MNPSFLDAHWLLLKGETLNFTSHHLLWSEVSLPHTTIFTCLQEVMLFSISIKLLTYAKLLCQQLLNDGS